MKISSHLMQPQQQTKFFAQVRPERLLFVVVLASFITLLEVSGSLKVQLQVWNKKMGTLTEVCRVS